MREVHVFRTKQIGDGVFGRLQVLQGGIVMHNLCTMEDDWKNNEPFVSCIPAGEFPLRRSIYYKYGYETFQICDVPGRSRILIHPANTEEDVMGCIGLGLRFGKLLIEKDEDTGELNVMKEAVVASQEGFKKFMDAMRHVDETIIRIYWANGLPQ